MADEVTIRKVSFKGTRSHLHCKNNPKQILLGAVIHPMTIFLPKRIGNFRIVLACRYQMSTAMMMRGDRPPCTLTTTRREVEWE